MSVGIGVDPGQKGGIAYVSPSWVQAFPMPLLPKEEQKAAGTPINWFEVYRLFSQWDVWENYLCVEKVWGMPGQGASSTFKFGGNFVGILATAQIMGAKRELVVPRKWKSAVLGDEYEHDKEGAFAFCADHYPQVSLLPSSRHRKPHDGMADALCLAHYAAFQQKK